MARGTQITGLGQGLGEYTDPTNHAGGTLTIQQWSTVPCGGVGEGSIQSALGSGLEQTFPVSREGEPRDDHVAAA